MAHPSTVSMAETPRRAQRAIAPLLQAAALQLLLLATSGTPASATAPAKEPAKPKLTVEDRVYEAGEVARDKVVEHTFKLHNAGDAVLEIRKIIVAANLEIVARPTTVAPGATADLTVRVPLLNDKPVALLKQLEVESNDPETPKMALEVRILSTEYVAAKPGYARWISVLHEKPGTISQTLAALDGQDFELLRTSPPPPGVSSAISVIEQEPGKARKWKLDLTLAEDAPVGPIVGTLLVHVSHPKQSIVPIPLSGFMRPIVVVTPNVLNVGELVLTAKQSQAFTVKSYSTAPVRVTKVEHDLEGFAPAALEERVAGREYRLKLDFDPATLPKGPFKGTLKIHTDSAKVPLLTVPLEGTIR
jgi:hypothetical protein